MGRLERVSLRSWLRLQIMPVELRVNLRSRLQNQVHVQAAPSVLATAVPVQLMPVELRVNLHCGSGFFHGQAAPDQVHGQAGPGELAIAAPKPWLRVKINSVLTHPPLLGLRPWHSTTTINRLTILASPVLPILLTSPSSVPASSGCSASLTTTCA